MKAEELMVGDRVSVIGLSRGGRITGIHKGYEGYVVDTRNYNNYDECRGVEFIRPIPITPEILEKSLFTKSENRRSWIRFFDEVKGSFIEIKENKTNPDYKWTLEAGGFKSFSCRAFINNVHELQHIMRMLGIENGIEL